MAASHQKRVPLKIVLTGIAMLIACPILIAYLAIKELTTPDLPPPNAGRIIFSSGWDWRIYTMQADGSNLTQLEIPNAYDEQFRDPVWSPDGTRIAYLEARLSPNGVSYGDNRIYVSKADGTESQILVDMDQGAASPVSWSPDGTRIVLTLNGKGLFIVNADGTNLVQLTEETDYDPDWSPDGKTILFIRFPRDEYNVSHLFTIDIDGSNLRQLTSGDENVYSGKWSSDGTRIAFERHREEGKYSIYLIDVDGSNEELLIGGEMISATQATWSPDDSYIAFYLTVFMQNTSPPSIIDQLLMYFGFRSQPQRQWYSGIYVIPMSGGDASPIYFPENDDPFGNPDWGP